MPHGFCQLPPAQLHLQAPASFPFPLSNDLFAPEDHPALSSHWTAPVRDQFSPVPAAAKFSQPSEAFPRFPVSTVRRSLFESAASALESAAPFERVLHPLAMHPLDIAAHCQRIFAPLPVPAAKNTHTMQQFPLSAHLSEPHPETPAQTGILFL